MLEPPNFALGFGESSIARPARVGNVNARARSKPEILLLNPSLEPRPEKETKTKHFT